MIEIRKKNKTKQIKDILIDMATAWDDYEEAKITDKEMKAILRKKIKELERIL